MGPLINFAAEKRVNGEWIADRTKLGQKLLYISYSYDFLLALWTKNGLQKLLDKVADPDYRLRVVSDEEATEIINAPFEVI